MRSSFLFKSIIPFVLLVQGCSTFENTYQKQVLACEDDIIVGLGNPESFEVIHSEVTESDNGLYRLKLYYSAENNVGGRIRTHAVCGFSDKNTTKLNLEDYVNKARRVARLTRYLGII